MTQCTREHIDGGHETADPGEITRILTSVGLTTEEQLSWMNFFQKAIETNGGHLPKLEETIQHWRETRQEATKLAVELP